MHWRVTEHFVEGVSYVQVYLRGLDVAFFIRLAPKIEQHLNVLAVREGQTKAHCLHEITHNGLTDLEEHHLAMKVLRCVHKNTEAVHSALDVRKYLGLDD